ncbi:MAG: DUF1684 domain-containing protein [Halodesulfurarchaeum sp.]
MDSNGSEDSEWTETIRTHRSEKESTFASEAETPLSETARAQFDGLQFFPIAPEYRVTGRLEVFPEPREAALEATRGPPMPFEKVGQLGVQLDGELSVLAVYRAAGVESLLVPFRDRTNGETTWRHGRYVTLSAPASIQGAGEHADREKPENVTVDFNLAYHPLCVYDETVRSAKPPTDNELPVAIRAGERR